MGILDSSRMIQLVALAYSVVAVFWIGYNVGVQSSTTNINIPLTIVPPLLWPLGVFQIVLAYLTGIYIGDEYNKLKQKIN